MNAAAIAIAGLSHSFRGHQALRGVAFSVAAGEIHGFVGPNGAGKTTTLKVLATLLQPDRGQVQILGDDVRRAVTQVRRRIGFMPDHFSMYRNMRVDEYLDFFAAAYGLARSRREQVIGDVLSLTDMTGRRRDFIRGLSRGMQQRVCLARVLVHDPQLLLLDEPASGLDPRARIELMEILRELRGMGKTVFISSHILGELADLCDHVTVLDRGAVRYTGTMDGLLSGHAGEQRAWRIELHEACAEVAAALQGIAGLDGIEDDEGGLVWRLRGDAAQVDDNRLLQAVIGAGGRIRSFGADTRRLDQVFMELTTAGVRDA